MIKGGIMAMEETDLKKVLRIIELQFENWKYEDNELENCCTIVVSAEGYRYG